MDKPRGKSTGGRARGRPPQGGPSHQGPPAQKTAWGAPGRGGPSQTAPMEAAMSQMSLGATGGNGGPRPSGGNGGPRPSGGNGGPGASGGKGGPPPPRDGAEVSRGARRQGPIPEPRPLLTESGEKRPKQGITGKKERLKSNYFQFVLKPNMSLYQYRVDFNPDPDVTQIKKALLNVHKEELRAYIFDGTVLWTFHRIDEKKERISMRRNTQEPVRLLFKLTTDLQPGDPSYIQFLNLILRKVEGLMEWKLVGRDYYDPTHSISLPEYNLDIWPGYSTSIRQHEDRILLNVELSSKVLRQETAYHLLNVCSQGSRDYRSAFEENIIGTTVVTRYNNRNYKIDDVDWKSSPLTTFAMKGSQVSFRDYYKQKYEIRIQHNDQPLLVSNPSKRDLRAGKTDVVKLIPELCCLTGIDDAMRSNFHLMKAISNHTKVAPQDRIKRIEQNFLRTLTTRADTGAELKRWNMEFHPKVVELEGRKLNPEVITIGGGCSFPADEATGDFTKSITSSRRPLLHAPQLTKWVVIYPQRTRDQEVNNFVDVLKRASRSFQFMISDPKYEAIPDDRGNTYAVAIEKFINMKAEMVLCIVPNNRSDRYEAIKKKCYVNRSIPSQVVLARNVTKANMSVCTKIGIQIVCKQGGTPWSVSIPMKNVMIAGFDVCHDTQQREKSFGALVASVNGNHSRYVSFVSPHKRGEELCPFIGFTMKKAVTAYVMKNGTVPSKIVFYRDSVGEGNFHYVQEQEVGQIREQLKEFYGANPVPIVYVVVSKRINTRLFRAADDRNPLPGTIADSVVTSPHLYDFFLVSQSVHEGTVAPTSYVVLADEVNFKPDHLQQLTYKMCHMYYNWSGTVRVPAPVQYAHKLAYLVGQYLHNVPQAAEQNMEDILYFL